MFFINTSNNAYIDLKKKIRRINPLIYISTLAALFLLMGFLLMFKLYNDSQQKIERMKTNQPANMLTPPPPEDVDKLVSQVGRHLMLPSEEPKALTLTNVSNLKKNQPFFNSAKDGDKVLIYSQKVILYDPLADKIIDMAQIKPSELDTQSEAVSTITPVPEKYTIAVLNGTKDDEILDEIVNSVEKDSLFDVVSKGEARDKPYNKSLVISLKDASQATGTRVAQAIGARLSDMPKEEKNSSYSDADFLLIIGNDKL